LFNAGYGGIFSYRVANETRYEKEGHPVAALSAFVVGEKVADGSRLFSNAS
jgi:hypothetical protein